MSRRHFTAADVALPTHELQLADLRDHMETIKREITRVIFERDVARARVTELERNRCEACQATATLAAREYAESLIRRAAP
jgi:hypothetical protein